MGDDDLVFSTDRAETAPCPRCGKRPCVCPAEVPVEPARTTLGLRLERKGRGGRTVTVVYDLPPNRPYFQALAKRLKTRVGSGGSFKDDRIEVQGDRRDAVRKALEAEGFRVKGG